MENGAIEIENVTVEMNYKCCHMWGKRIAPTIVDPVTQFVLANPNAP